MWETIMGFGAAGILLVLLIWLLPIILIARSRKTEGGEKLIWILLVLFFSWFVWILYAIIAPLGGNRQ